MQMLIKTMHFLITPILIITIMLCSLGLSDPGSPPPSTDSPASTWVPRFHLRIIHLFTLYTTINQLNASFNFYQNFLVFLKSLLPVQISSWSEPCIKLTAHQILPPGYPTGPSYLTLVFVSVDKPIKLPIQSSKPEILCSNPWYFLDSRLRWLRAWALPGVRLTESLSPTN